MVVGLRIGSVSVTSDAIDSASDVLAAFITFFSVRIAHKPADVQHPYGHGKAESVGAAVEALIMTIGGGFIVYQAVDRIRSTSEVESVTLGIVVMGISLGINSFMSVYLWKASKATDSLALEAAARHRTTDVFTSLGVLVGLVVVRTAGIGLVDPAIGLAIAVLIFKTALDLFRKAFRELMDVRLPPEEEDQVRAALQAHYGDIVGFHDLRTRKAGRERHVDVHVVVCRYINVGEAHEIADRLEEGIKARLSHIKVNIHMEPCEYGPDGQTHLSCIIPTALDRGKSPSHGGPH